MSLHTTLDIIESHKNEMPEGLYLSLMNSAKRKFDEIGSAEPEKMYMVGMFTMIQKFIIYMNDCEQSTDVLTDSSDDIDPEQFIHVGARQLVSDPIVTPTEYTIMTMQQIKNIQKNKMFWGDMSLLTDDVLSTDVKFPFYVGYTSVSCRVHNCTRVCTRTHTYIISISECN